jgi:hypothetical protein
MMKKSMTVVLLMVFLLVTLFSDHKTTNAADPVGYWRLVGTGGKTGYISSGKDLKEDFSNPGSLTVYVYNEGGTELRHQAYFTWTQPAEKINPGEVFPFSATGKTVFHKEPWFIYGSMLMQFYGALYPMNWLVGDSNRPNVGVSDKVTIDAKVPVGNPDKTKDNHFMRLRLSAAGYGNSNPDPFHYIYEWVVSAKPNQPQIKGKNIFLSWSAVEGAKSYNIYRSKVSGKYDMKTPLTDFPIKDTFFTDDKALVGITYYYIIVPIMADGKEGPAFAEVSATVQEQKTIVLQIGNPYMEVNGKKQEIDPGRGTAPVLLSGRAVLPIRAVVEAMGGTVGWDANQQKVTLVAKGNTVELWIGVYEIRVNGQMKEIDVAPVEIKGRTMIPVRFVAENLNAEIIWDGDNQKITITY